MVLYPSFAWDEAAYHLEGDPEGRTFAEILVDVVATEVIEPWGGGKWHLEIFRSASPEAGGLERRDVEAYNPAASVLILQGGSHEALCVCFLRYFVLRALVAASALAQTKAGAQAPATKAAPVLPRRRLRHRPNSSRR